MERKPEPTGNGEADAEGSGASAPEEGSALERHLSIVFRESTLWPVLAAATGIFVTLGATLMLLAVKDRNVFAGAALLLLAGMSVDVTYRDLSRGRLGVVSRGLLALWTLSGAVAALVVWFDVF